MTVQPMMPNDDWAALKRLLEVARHDTHQARYCADFLLAWWNPDSCGGFKLTNLWGLDGDLRDAMVTVMGFIARHQVYPDRLGLGPEFEALVRLWRPQLVAAAEEATG